jgi:hypothetical protein
MKLLYKVYRFSLGDKGDKGDKEDKEDKGTRGTRGQGGQGSRGAGELCGQVGFRCNNQQPPITHYLLPITYNKFIVFYTHRDMRS